MEESLSAMNGGSGLGLEVEGSEQDPSVASGVSLHKMISCPEDMYVRITDN